RRFTAGLFPPGSSELVQNCKRAPQRQAGLWESPDVGLSAAKNRAQRISINSEGPTGKTVSQPELAGLPASAPLQRPLAVVKSFAATVSLKPGLIVGTAEPE